VADRKVAAVEFHSDRAGDFDQLYERIRSDPYSTTFTYGRKKIEEALDRELATLPSGAKGLDVGCGTGFNIARMRARGFQVVGLEPAGEMRRLAIEANPDTQVLAGDAESLPWDSETFDFVICIEVIRNLRSADQAIREMARVLKPGGLAFVTAAPLLSLNGYALLNAVTSRVAVPTFAKIPQSFVTAGGLRETALAAGFADVRVQGMFIGPWHVLGRISGRALSVMLRKFEGIDERVADAGLVRNLSNHLVLIARR
jgi:ubiquinone/menaquinone biosynthesis C-methylase UbiE